MRSLRVTKLDGNLYFERALPDGRGWEVVPLHEVGDGRIESTQLESLIEEHLSCYELREPQTYKAEHWFVSITGISCRIFMSRRDIRGGTVYNVRPAIISMVTVEEIIRNICDDIWLDFVLMPEIGQDENGKPTCIQPTLLEEKQ